MSTSIAPSPSTPTPTTSTRAGVEILEDNGFRVVRLETQDPAVIVAEATDAVALMVGYAQVTAEMVAACRACTSSPCCRWATTTWIWRPPPSAASGSANLVGVATDEVASHALGLALSARSIDRAARTTRAGGWQLENPPKATTESTLGVIGLGRIGSRLAEFAAPMFGEVVGYDPMLPDDDGTAAGLPRQGSGGSSSTSCSPHPTSCRCTCR